MKDSKILITSSDNFTTSDINQHLGLVDAQIVVGANLFRDVFSGFRDIFGGETKGYQKDIEKMKTGAISRLKDKAREKGANAVISTRIDLDEVSGGNKSMFMLNVYGSAVELDEAALGIAPDSDLINEISVDDINFHLERNRIKKNIEDADHPLDVVTIDQLSEFDLLSTEIANQVMDYFSGLTHNESLDFSLADNISDIPTESINYLILNHVDKLNITLYENLIHSLEEIDWYDLDVINSLLQSENYIERFITTHLNPEIIAKILDNRARAIESAFAYMN